MDTNVCKFYVAKVLSDVSFKPQTSMLKTSRLIIIFNNKTENILTIKIYDLCFDISLK